MSSDKEPILALMRSTTWSGDVVVIGGGVAGGFCATLLARAGCRVLLVDARGSPRRPAEILSPTTIRLLRRHGLAELHGTEKVAVCRGTYGLWGPHPECIDYQLQACDIGACVDRAEFDTILLRLAGAAGADVCQGGRVRNAHYADTVGWHIEITQTQNAGSFTAVAPLLIEATGRTEGAAIAHPGNRTYDDQLFAMVCPAQVPPNDCQFLFLEAAPNGWWYSTSLSDGRGAVVYLSDLDLMPSARVTRELFFRNAFESSRLIRTKVNLPAAIDLKLLDARTSLRRSLVGAASMTIGDAAYSVDPLSGTGIYRSLEMAERAAAEGIRFLHGSERGIRDYENFVLSGYEGWRLKKNAVYASADQTVARGTFWQRRDIHM